MTAGTPPGAAVPPGAAGDPEAITPSGAAGGSGTPILPGMTVDSSVSGDPSVADEPGEAGAPELTGDAEVAGSPAAAGDPDAPGTGGEAGAAAATACPACGERIATGDNFCEACGADLAVPPPAAAAALPAVAGGSCRFCPGGVVGPDGYCESCGRKVAAARDHIEADLGLVAGVTDRGLRHLRNEDAMALAVVPGATGPTAIAVVSDGVSDSSRPDEGSLAAVRAALAVLLAAAGSGGDQAAAAQRAAAAARDAVTALARPPRTGTRPEATEPASQDGPAATYVSAVVTAGAVTVCWLGDSRAYWLDAGSGAAARPLTADDSLATQLVAAGVLTEAEALTSAHAHVVTGWLGADASDVAPHVASFTPPGPGVVLVCSDGLWNYEPEAAGLAARALPTALSDPLAAARALTEFALAQGGRDNITSVLVPFPLAETNGPALSYPEDLPVAEDAPVAEDSAERDDE